MKRKLVMTVLVASVGFSLTNLAANLPLTEGKFLLFPQRDLAFAESTHHFDVRHYRIDLDLSMSSGAMTAHTRVELIARVNNFDTFSLHFVNLVCDSVKRAGNICSFNASGGKLFIDLDQEFGSGESLAVDIYYHRNSGTQNRGFFFYQQGTQGIPHSLCYSTTEPADARYWFPCFDEPWDKAERGCQVNITVPDSLAGCANGILDSVTMSDGKKTFWWTHRYPISTYLITFAASKWASFKQWFYLAPGESTYVENFMWPEDSIRAVNAFQNVVDMLYFFADSVLYGRYPFEKYGHVVVYPFQWGGMENQTLTMVHRAWIVWGNDNGLAHELSHHWWGDMVTCVDWRNIWLNEGFATYSDALYTRHQQGHSAFLDLMGSRAEDYFQEEAEDPHPIYDPPPDHLFDWGHSYCKGAWVQHMLRYVEGDTNWVSPGIFFQALHNYGESLKYRNASTEDYQRIHEQMTGLDLNWFFDEWVYQLGYPNYTVGWQAKETETGWEVNVDLSQNNMAGAPQTFHIPVEVKFFFASGETLIRYPVIENPQRNVFVFTSQPTGLEFDPNNWVLDEHTVTVGVAEQSPLAKGKLIVNINPNPVREKGFLKYFLPQPGKVTITLFDPSGRVVQTLFTGNQSAGEHQIGFKLNQPNGVYIVELVSGRENVRKKMLLLN
ncbi:MAG: M1 family aminopeptidase [candidate division WOR-3 bacterium]